MAQNKRQVGMAVGVICQAAATLSNASAQLSKLAADAILGNGALSEGEWDGIVELVAALRQTADGIECAILSASKKG